MQELEVLVTNQDGEPVYRNRTALVERGVEADRISTAGLNSS